MPAALRQWYRNIAPLRCVAQPCFRRTLIHHSLSSALPPLSPPPPPPPPQLGAVVPLRHIYVLGHQPGMTAACRPPFSPPVSAPELPESLHSELHARSHSARASSGVAGVRAVKLGAAAAEL